MVAGRVGCGDGAGWCKIGVADDGICARSLWSGEYDSGGVMFIWPLVWEEPPWR